MTDSPAGRPMRVCLLGCGWAAELHSRTLRNLRRDVQCSYASRSIEKARALNGKHNGAGAFGSYEDAIASASVDVVAVLTPPASHLQWALRAIGEGKDVILEKPPVLRSDDVDQIAAACQAAGRHVYVAENYYYKPVLARVRDLLAARAVGEPLYIHLNAVKRQKTANWRDAAEQAGGGALFEGGIHWVNFAGALGLTIRSVKAARPGTGTGLERSMALLIEYVEGPVAVLTYSWEVSSRLRGLMRLSRVYGREGGIVFESNGLFVASWGRKSHLSFPLGDIQGYRAMFADFVRAWRQGGDAQMTLARARRDLEVVEEAYRSAGVAMSGVASGHGA